MPFTHIFVHKGDKHIAMKTSLFRFALYAIIVYITPSIPNPVVAASESSAGNGTHFCGVTDNLLTKQFSDQFSNRRYARSFAANLNIGEPRTVRMIYFLPNDRPYRPNVVQKMKDEILSIQTFYAEQMESHGYGRRTFRVETDAQGEPMVHRVEGRYPDSHYVEFTEDTVRSEIYPPFDIEQNVYLVVIDNSIDGIGYGGSIHGGAGRRPWKNGGDALVSGEFEFGLVAHELGHAFGLDHDFSDGAYIMSYGPGQTRLSACHAEYLFVHPYFNLDIPIDAGDRPTVELISPRSYPASSQSVLVRVKVNDSDGLHQVILYAAQPDNRRSVKVCRGLGGKKEVVIEFDYDGVIPSAHDPAYSRNTSLLNPLIHPIIINPVDMNGNTDTWGSRRSRFFLFSEALEPLTKISGDNLQGLPNTPLPAPFVVELRDLNDGSARRGVPVTFTVTAGGGTLSVERVKTNHAGRAESMLTLGPNLETNTVEVYAEGHTVTFNAVVGAPVDIPDTNLRAVIEDALDKSPGTPIAPAEIATLTHLKARNANISDLTGLEHATNLTFLDISDNRISDISLVAGLINLTLLDLDGNALSDISPVAGLTNLTFLDIWRTPISDISPIVGLINLTVLGLGYNSISDLSPLIANTELGEGDKIYVRGNPLSYQSIHTHIPTLQSRGVTVEFDNRISATPLKILGDNQQSVPGTTLKQPFALDVQDQNGERFAGVPVVFTVTEGGGVLSITSTVTDANGRAESTLTLGPNPGTNTVEVSVEGIPQPAIFSAEAALPPPVPTTLSIVSGDNQSGLTGEVLANPFVVKVRDQYDAPMEGVTVTLAVSAGGGTPSPEMTTTDANGQAETTLTLGPNPGTNTVEVSVEGISQTVVFSAEAALPPPVPTTLSIVSGDNQSGLTGEVLANPFVVKVRDQYDAPMEGVTVTLAVSAGGGTPSPEMTTTDANGQAETTLTLGPNPGTNTVEVSVEGITEMVTFNAIAKLLEFDLSVPTDISLIHVPLKVATVNGIEKTIESVGDLYDALGGADIVNFLVTLDSQSQKWHSYFGTSNTGTDRTLTVDMGIIASMKTPASIRLTGNSLGTDGSSTVTLNQGLNLVGLPLRDERINRVSDLLRLAEIWGNVSVITLNDGGKFKAVGRAGDPGDIAITGGQAFILNARQTATVEISGDGWTNVSVTAAAPPMLTGIQVGNTTPVLALSDSIVDEETGKRIDSFRVTVKNLSTGKAATAVAGSDKTDYRHIIVDIETGRAATVGDILEISAQSSDPFIGVQPLRYTVTVEDVKRNHIELPSLVAYEIPAETELLANYPNPFNPETWIPYRLAEDAFVTLTIYGLSGRVVRTLNVGHRIASAYENRSKAIYWDGGNDVGEPVASGVYFYTLTAGDFSATRRMVILK